MTKIAGSGSISHRHGSADPDPDPPQNVMDPHSVTLISRDPAKNSARIKTNPDEWRKSDLNILIKNGADPRVPVKSADAQNRIQ